jgi:hypothetical protein
MQNQAVCVMKALSELNAIHAGQFSYWPAFLFGRDGLRVMKMSSALPSVEKNTKACCDVG